MIAEPSAALRLWLVRCGVSEATVHVSARSRNRFAARVGPTTAHDRIRAAAADSSAVEMRNDGMVVFNPSRLFEELGLTAAGLSGCDNADCDRTADRYVVFPDSEAVREYCSGHASRARRLTEA